jgi:hypothetical protein
MWMFSSGGEISAQWDGDGTEKEPYLIQTFADLDTLSYLVNNGNSYTNIYFSQKNDIYTSSAFTSIGTETYPFRGNYDGLSKQIHFTYQRTSGLFDYVNHATLKNLYVEMTLFGNGGIVANNADSSYFEECYSMMEVSELDTIAGGIVGISNHCYYSRCFRNGGMVSPTSSGIYGGIIGLSQYDTVIACLNGPFAIHSNGYLGGIAGKAIFSYFSNCNVTGDFHNNSYSSCIGGIVGEIKNCVVDLCYCNEGSHITASVGEGSYLGGIVGKISPVDSVGPIEYSVISNCVNYSNILSHSYSSTIGGILGGMDDSSSSDFATLYSEIYNCENTGHINGVNIIGGIAGEFTTGEISYCTNIGRITVTNSITNVLPFYYYVGGILGNISMSLGAGTDGTNINNCSNSGYIDITNSLSTTPAGSLCYAGGVIGVTGGGEDTIVNCINTNNINYSNINPANITMGGIAGFIEGDILEDVLDNCFYDIQLCPISEPIGGLAVDPFISPAEYKQYLIDHNIVSKFTLNMIYEQLLPYLDANWIYQDSIYPRIGDDRICWISAAAVLFDVTNNVSNIKDTFYVSTVNNEEWSGEVDSYPLSFYDGVCSTADEGYGYLMAQIGNNVSKYIPIHVTSAFKRGFNEDNALFSVSEIYPNPVKGQANIALFANENGVLNISVYDWAGANVMNVASGVSISANSNYVFPINVGKLSSGRYNCVVSINDNKFVKYFIINK